MGMKTTTKTTVTLSTRYMTSVARSVWLLGVQSRGEGTLAVTTITAIVTVASKWGQIVETSDVLVSIEHNAYSGARANLSLERVDGDAIRGGSPARQLARQVVAEILDAKLAA